MTRRAAEPWRGRDQAPGAPGLHRANHAARSRRPALPRCTERARAGARRRTVAPLHGGRVDFADLRRATAPATPEIIVTGASLADNWFSHTDVDHALLNIGDWELAFSNDLSLPAYAPDAYILESFALTSFLLCCRAEDIHYVHEVTTGCLLDLCVRRAERAIKMRSGYMCALCKSRAAAAGVSPIGRR